MPGSGGIRTEKSPFMICSAALTIVLTGRSTSHLRRRPSMTVHKRLKNRMLTKVSLAALSILSLVRAMPVAADSSFKKRSMQQLMTNAISRKKAR